MSTGLKQLQRNRKIFHSNLAQMPQPALICGPGIKAFGRSAHRALSLSLGNGRSDGDRYRLGDLVLDREDIGEIAVVTLGPNVVAGFGLDQLRGDADAVAGLRRLPSST
jgi:hypothetical protein